MAQRGGGHGGGGGSGNRGKKNRLTPYKMGREGGGVTWRSQQDQQKSDSLLPTPSNHELDQTAVSRPVQIGGDTNVLSTHTQTKKFTNKARLFFGNLPRDFSEDELKKLLAAHGEVQEIYHNKDKNFAFARMVCVFLE